MNASVLKKIYDTMERERIRKEYFGEDSPLKEEEKPQEEKSGFLSHALMLVVPACAMFLYHVVSGE